MVIWLIGLSGSGKTTLGTQMYSLLKSSYSNTIFIDGDMTREILGSDLGYSIEDRWTNAQRISKLCFHLERQGTLVVCAILSIFHESQKWNRDNFREYKEVFVDISFDTLKHRDFKGLYERAQRNEITNVVGVDIDFKPPYAPDVTINNNRENANMAVLAEQVIEQLEIELNPVYQYSAENRLKRREQYQYTPFKGESFLDSYTRTRLTSIDLLQRKIQKFENLCLVSPKRPHPFAEFWGLSEIASVYFNQELPLSEESGEVENQLHTRTFLVYSLHEFIRRSTISKSDRILSLLNRFEVSKKIHNKYGLLMFKKTSNDSDDYITYMLFANILSLLYRDASMETRMIFLNCLLKVNDLLESIINEFATPVEHYLTVEAYKKELYIYRSLFDEKLK